MADEKTKQAPPAPVKEKVEEEKGDGRKRLRLRKSVETAQITQSFSHRRTKTVELEVKRRQPGARPRKPAAEGGAARTTPVRSAPAPRVSPPPPSPRTRDGKLSEQERAARTRAVEQARERETQRLVREEASRVARIAREKNVVEADPEELAPVAAPRPPPDDRRAPRRAPERGSRAGEAPRGREAAPGARTATAAPARGAASEAGAQSETEAAPARAKRKRETKGSGAKARGDAPRRRAGKLTINQALEGEEYENRMRSLAAMRRKRAREKQEALSRLQEGGRIVREVIVPETIQVFELASRMAERVEDVVGQLQRLGVKVARDDIIDADTAELIVSEYNHKVRRVTAADVELGLDGALDAKESLQPRAPVVAVMGHVDHGKTSLLDAIRKSDQAAGEAGGITQHIGASYVEIAGGRHICFIDTPGHTAFTALRARGARVTDIVILVVAADDGVKEQTREARDHARAANVAVIVAVNKMDRPEADLARVKNELLSLELVSEDMGGEVLVVPTSAKDKVGIDDLLEAVSLQGELLNLTANPDRPAGGVVLEARREQGLGPVATVLIQRGTLRRGDSCLVGSVYGKVRTLTDWHGKRINQAGPSEPVEVAGLGEVPEAGDPFVVVESEQRAREIAESRHERKRQAGFAGRAKVGAADAEEFLRQMEAAANAIPVVNFILKGDVQGSVEAVSQALEKISGDEVGVRILHAGVGGINESDILLASATGASILGFSVRAQAKARNLARTEGVSLEYYNTIYELTDAVTAIVEGKLTPETKEEKLGEAEIREVFDITKFGKVAGCLVLEGLVRKNARARVVRDGEILHDGKLRSLRRFKDEVSEVKNGTDCGLAFETFQGFLQGDKIECYELREIPRSL